MAGDPLKVPVVVSGSNELALADPTCPARDTTGATTQGLRADALGQYQGFVWRVMRWMGVREPDLEDATQRVFLMVVGKTERIRPGCERAYLYTTAVRLARRIRRSRRDRGEVESSEEEAIDPSLDPEARLSHRQTLALLDDILDQMPDDLREVFLLCEVEQLTMREVSETLGLPSGTIASRLRRAREELKRGIDRAKAQARIGGDR